MSDEASCSIVLAPTNKSFYLPGEIISGNINLTVNAPISIKYMKLAIVGQVKCTVRLNTPAYTDPTTRTEAINFCIQKQSLFVPITNGISFNEGGYHFEPNTYRWPFSMRLPESLPPTLAYAGLGVPYSEYCLRVKMNRSWFHRDIRYETSIKIGCQISRLPEVKPLKTEASNFMGLRIHGQLLRNYLLIGDRNITLELKIQNPSQTTIKGATVKLIQLRRLPGRSGRVTVFKGCLPDIVNFQNIHLRQIFQITVIPAIELSVPTGDYKYPDNHSGACFVSYVLEVKFKTRLFFNDVKLQFPLIVANSEASNEGDI